MNSQSEKLKIAIFVSHFPVLSETFIYNQCISLLKLGHEVKIYSRNKVKFNIIHKEIMDSDLFNNVTYIPILHSNWLLRTLKAILFILKNIFALSKILPTLNFFKYKKDAFRLNIFFNSIPFLPFKEFDVIHCHFGYVGNDILKLIEIGILKGKFITSFHGIDLSNQILKTQCYDQLFSISDFLIANTSFTKKKLLALNCPSIKIKIIPVGLDIHKFSPRKKLPITEEKFKLISIGRLIEVKGMQNCINVMDLLVNENNIKNVILTIIGEGPLLSNLENQIAELKLGSYINLIGKQTQEEIINRLQESQIFLLLGNKDGNGREETQGLVIQEAQAMEVPVIASNFGGVAEGLIDGVTGFLVDPGDIFKATSLIINLINNPTLINKMGKNARKFVVNKYDQRLITAQLLNLYY
jgi:colanic acid/amylovoran biosynthesis glycosyltransferase